MLGGTSFVRYLMFKWFQSYDWDGLMDGSTEADRCAHNILCPITPQSMQQNLFENVQDEHKVTEPMETRRTQKIKCTVGNANKG